MTEANIPPRVVYDSVITAVGGQVEKFLDHGLLVFFGENSPRELHDMSVRHRPRVQEEGPQPGDTLILADKRFEVLAVGDVVRDNLLNLGHLDLKADGLSAANLPGDVCVAKQQLPLPAPGDAFRILRDGTATTGGTA